MNWIFLGGAVFLGIIGAVSDIVLSKWAEKMTWPLWSGSAILFLIFMTGLGLCIKYAPQNVSLTSLIITVLLVNISGIAIWDYWFNEVNFNSLQIVGIVLGVIAIVLMEIKK